MKHILAILLHFFRVGLLFETLGAHDHDFTFLWYFIPILFAAAILISIFSSRYIALYSCWRAVAAGW